MDGADPPKSLLHLSCQRAWFGARGTTSATAGFGERGARDPRNPKTTGQLGGPGGLTNVQPAPPDVWKVSRHGLGVVGPLLRPPGLVGSQGLRVSEPFSQCGPKTTVRLGGPWSLPKVQPVPPDVWKVSWHDRGAAGPLL